MTLKYVLEKQNYKIDKSWYHCTVLISIFANKQRCFKRHSSVQFFELKYIQVWVIVFLNKPFTLEAKEGTD